MILLVLLLHNRVFKYLANGANITGIVTVGVTTIKSGEIEVVGVLTATTVKAGSAISITDGAISATRFHGSGS